MDYHVNAEIKCNGCRKLVPFHPLSEQDAHISHHHGREGADEQHCEKEKHKYRQRIAEEVCEAEGFRRLPDIQKEAV